MIWVAIGVGVWVASVLSVWTLCKIAKRGDEHAKDDMSFPELEDWITANIEDDPLDWQLGQGIN